MEELTTSKKSTASGRENVDGKSSTPPVKLRPRDTADDCSCICQLEENMSGIHSAHKKM